MSGWIVGGVSTKVEVVCEMGTSSNAIGPSQKKLVLRGYHVQTFSSLAASTVTAKLVLGESSAVGTQTLPICLDSPEVSHTVNGLNVTANYFAISAGSTHVKGLHASMWGDYA
jgi:hypothetical protein